MRSIVSVIIISASMLHTSCGDSNPSGVIKESQMVGILYDYHIARTMAMQSGDSSAYKSKLFTEAVFYKHGITEEEFDSSLSWYTRNNDILYSIYDKVNKRYEKFSTQLGDLESLEGANGVSEGERNYWPLATAYMLTPTSIHNRLTFGLPTDTLLHEGDRIELSFDTRFVYRSGARAAIMQLAIRYANDSVITTTQRIFGDGRQTLSLNVGDAICTKEVYGLVYLDAEPSAEVKLLLISGIRMKYYASPKQQVNNTADSSRVQTQTQENIPMEDPGIIEAL